MGKIGQRKLQILFGGFVDNKDILIYYGVMSNLKIQITLVTLLTLLIFFSAPSETQAVVQSLNGQTGQTQTFQNDSSVTISSSNNIHSIVWQGQLPLSRGGTGTSSFTSGSVLFSDGNIITQNNLKLFWDNANSRLGIGTSSPTATLDVNGTAKVTSLTSANDSIINGLTVGLGAGSAINNTAVGVNALASNTTGGNGNVAIGFETLSSNTGGFNNTAVGSQAGGLGSANTAVGHRALNRSTGDRNSAVGNQTLVSNTTGVDNTAMGEEAMVYNSTGHDNVALGSAALQGNTTGSLNVALGLAALHYVTGDGNTAIGWQAGRLQATDNLLNSATKSIYIGFLSRAYDNNDNNSIVIGADAVGAGANKAVIGNSSMTDIYLGSVNGNSNIHGKKLYLGSSSVPGCIVMGDTNGGVGYITLVNGVLTSSTIPPSACQ